MGGMKPGPRSTPPASVLLVSKGGRKLRLGETKRDQRRKERSGGAPEPNNIPLKDEKAP